MTRLRRSAALLAASIAALAFAGGVQAKSFDFPQANVQVVVQADGSLLGEVSEVLHLPHGDVLVVRGRVWGYDTRRPLPFATLDIWQADHTELDLMVLDETGRPGRS